MENDRLRRRREQILTEIARIHRLRQGQLSEQYYERVCVDGRVRRQGPYYVLQRWRNRKKESVRIAPEQVDSIREDLKAYERLRQLTQEFADVTEQCSHFHTADDSKKKPRKYRPSAMVKRKPSSK